MRIVLAQAGNDIVRMQRMQQSPSMGFAMALLPAKGIPGAAANQASAPFPPFIGLMCHNELMPDILAPCSGMLQD